MRKQLESPIGNLQHTCTIILPGRTFLRRMINLLSAFQRDDHPTGLNQELRLDLSRWREFFHSWYGLSFLLFPKWAPLPYFSFSSDAARALGYCALFYPEWFVGKLSASQLPLQAAGIPGKFTSQSFRIGAATTAAQWGILDHLVKTTGRWSSET